MWLIKADKYMFQTIRHRNQTKSKKPLYIKLKITCKIRIIDMHEGHIMKNPEKSITITSPQRTLLEHMVDLTYPHTNTNLYLHTHLNKYIHFYIYTHTQYFMSDSETNLFYFEELDVSMPSW